MIAPAGTAQQAVSIDGVSVGVALGVAVSAGVSVCVAVGSGGWVSVAVAVGGDVDVAVGGGASHGNVALPVSFRKFFRS